MHEPSKVQVLEQLDRLVTSDEFKSSPRKQRFLRYIVEKTLDGEQDRLKGFSIGVDVFDRGEQFDPQADTIVRVQARNLRRALKLYYLSAGKNDPVRIQLVKGGYTPRFSIQTQAITNADPVVATAGEGGPLNQSTPVESFNNKNWFRTVSLLTILGVAILITFVMMRGEGASADGFSEAVKLPKGPSIAIAPFETSVLDSTSSGDRIATLSLQTGLHFQLVDKLSRFKDLFVVELKRDDEMPALEVKLPPDTQFTLTGSIQKADDQILVTGVLARTSNGEVLWSESYDEKIEGTRTLLEIQSQIAIDVATKLGQSNSGLNKKFNSEQVKLAGVGLDHYYCLMGFYQYTTRKNEEEHLRIRSCLEEATSEMPNFSSGWAALSWMYADEKFNNFNVREGEESPSNRAHEAALRAVEADPDNAMAYQYLAIAKFAIGDDAGFRTAAERALKLNPNDAEVLADVGSHLIQLDNSDQGKDMVKKAIAMNPFPPSWYHGSITMYYYLRNDTDNALHHARQYVRDGSLPANALLTSVLVQGGLLGDARNSYRELVELYPHFPSDYERIIESWRLPVGMDGPLIDDLKLAGLATAG